MKKRKITLASLIMNVIAVIVTSVMLIGSTFAWFTDSATSSGNKIQAGTLKVDLELLGKEEGWVSLKNDNQAIFNYDKWEPGYTDVKILKVQNEGSLALQWKAKFISENELSSLANVIDVYVLPSQTELAYPTDRNLDGYTKVGTVADFVNTIETTTKGVLLAGEEAYLGIALKMQTTAGNEYQGLDLGGAFDIVIIATQLSSETDGFSDGYDGNAEFPQVYSTVNLSNGLETDGSAVLDAKADTTLSAIIPADLVNTLKQNGVNTVSLVHTTPIIDEDNYTVTFESVEFVDEDGDVIDLSENTKPITVTLPAQPQFKNMSVTIKHDGEVVAIIDVGEDGVITYETTHFCEVVIEGKVVADANGAFELFNSFDQSGKSGKVVLNADYSTVDAEKHWSSNREYALRAAGTDVDFDMNGKTITHNTPYQNGNNTGYTYLFTTAYGSKLTVGGEGSIYSQNDDGFTCIFYAQGDSEIVINDGNYHAVNGVPIWAGNGATVTINGGSFTSSESGDQELIYSSGGKIYINGGFFHNTGWENRPVNVANANRGTGFIYISGGTFVNFDPSSGGDDPNNIVVVDGYKVISEIQENGDVWYVVVPK